MRSQNRFRWWHQAITRASVDPDQYHHMASLHNELTKLLGAVCWFHSVCLSVCPCNLMMYVSPNLCHSFTRWGLATRVHIFVNWSLLYNEVVGGVYWFHSVRPSVRLSVRPSVPHAMSALYHLQLWMDSFHIRHKWSLPWEGVSRTMTFDLDLYLQGRSALT